MTDITPRHLHILNAHSRKPAAHSTSSKKEKDKIYKVIEKLQIVYVDGGPILRICGHPC
jgi:hypothetical protein